MPGRNPAVGLRVCSGELLLQQFHDAVRCRSHLANGRLLQVGCLFHADLESSQHVLDGGLELARHRASHGDVLQDQHLQRLASRAQSEQRRVAVPARRVVPDRALADHLPGRAEGGHVQALLPRVGRQPGGPERLRGAGPPALEVDLAAPRLGDGPGVLRLPAVPCHLPQAEVRQQLAHLDVRRPHGRDGLGPLGAVGLDLPAEVGVAAFCDGFLVGLAGPDGGGGQLVEA
mmetsp:Transcript_5278/g.14938  ORF Transcript_5278/g.14938 Transcript_5278/m.14938 type:complete len:231 (-) Transcript_5278:455-1147(-)